MSGWYREPEPGPRPQAQTVEPLAQNPGPNPEPGLRPPDPKPGPPTQRSSQNAEPQVQNQARGAQPGPQTQDQCPHPKPGREPEPGLRPERTRPKTRAHHPRNHGNPPRPAPWSPRPRPACAAAAAAVLRVRGVKGHAPPSAGFISGFPFSCRSQARRACASGSSGEKAGKVHAHGSVTPRGGACAWRVSAGAPPSGACSSDP